MQPVYTAGATATGGRFDGRVRAGELELVVNPPGGDAGGTNPEELFAAGYAACFANAAILIARRTQQDPTDLEVASAVTLNKRDDGSFELGVRLRMTAPALTQEAAERLVQAAHERCPYSRATRGNVAVELAAVGGA